MIFESPPLTEADEAVLAAIEELRKDLRFYLAEPRRWYGSLRRVTFAWAVQGSNSIEGYHASVEDVVAVIEDEEPLETDEEIRGAITGYRDAMTYVLQLADAPPVLDESLLKSLHFMMLKHELSKHPGQWRPGGIWIENEEGEAVYAAPGHELIGPLMEEALSQIAHADGPSMVRAALAHLNLTMIHPFSDGNGRMARCVQSFVLAAEGELSPVFLSIEEYLGRNTGAYYQVLAEVGRGARNPARSARPWIEFCLTAHYRQARTVLRRIRETEALWDRCEQSVARAGVPDRSVGALVDAARGFRLRRSLYVKLTESATGEPISDDTASRDLKACSDAGLLVPFGEKRGRYYRASEDLKALWVGIRQQRGPRDEEDPYVTVLQPRLSGMGV